ncbi:MAG: helix-turn-helix transcriptional regulator [Planctomycetes bacterium]|nr:helix-turn-helix transcriptional regulator [Planctomycetota bacterium]
MKSTLFADIADAFRKRDEPAVSDLLATAVNRAARLIGEGNRESLTGFWRDVARLHYAIDAEELPAGLRERRGYLEAIVHLAKAVRDESDDPEAIQGVKKSIHGPAILDNLRRDGPLGHGELAQRLGISPPRLTAVIRSLDKSRTIAGTVHGKFKYYSLTPTGHVVARRLGQPGPLREGIVWELKKSAETAEGLSSLLPADSTPRPGG